MIKNLSLCIIWLVPVLVLSISSCNSNREIGHVDTTVAIQIGRDLDLKTASPIISSSIESDSGIEIKKHGMHGDDSWMLLAESLDGSYVFLSIDIRKKALISHVKHSRKLVIEIELDGIKNNFVHEGGRNSEIHYEIFK